MSKLTKQGLILITGIIISLGFSLSLQSIIAATWVAPNQAAPNSALSELVNVGGAGLDQTIGGDLQITENFIVDPIAPTTPTLFVNAANHRVGIGTNNPATELDVVGDINTSGDLTVAGNVQATSFVGDGSALTGITAGQITGLSSGKWEDGATAGEIYYNAGFVGIGTDDPEVELDIIGKAQSSPTLDADPGDTLTTKSYVDSAAKYVSCGWRNGQMCNVDELMKGYSGTQVYCCGLLGASCTATAWATYSTVCSVSCAGVQCGTLGGIWQYYQSRTMADCLVQYQIVNGGACFVNCGSCLTGYHCNGNTCVENGCSCFVTGTQVSMADGTFKNIEDVLIGDLVFGVDGSVNEVLKYDRPTVAGRLIYIINGSVKFTGEHPFMSTDGWKVADLELFYEQKATHNRYNGIEPTEMKVGDVLIVEDGLETVETITTEERPADEMVYDFEVSGTHTYIADGFVVWDSK